MVESQERKRTDIIKKSAHLGRYADSPNKTRGNKKLPAVKRARGQPDRETGTSASI